MSTANDRRWAAALAALDANLLVALDALLQESNVTRAARRVGITQSAMSQTLGRLRRQFDDPILVRVGRQMELSPFAHRIRARLHAAIVELEAVVRDRPDFDPALADRRFVVATVDYLAMLLAPPLRELIDEEAPHVRLALRGLDPASVTDPLAEGAVDLYVGVRGDTERALQTQSLHQESLALLVDPHHPFVRSGTSARDYAAARHVHVSPRREAGSIVGRAIRALGHEREVSVEVPYFALLPGVLDGSDLVATVPRRIAEHLAYVFDLAVIAPPLELPTFEVCMAWHPTHAQDPGLKWLREAVARVAAALDEG